MTDRAPQPERTSEAVTPRKVEFLERGNYRQRRFRDAARMVPLFAAVLMMVPLMWPRDTPDQSLTSSGMIYLFGLWVILIIVAFVLSLVLRFDRATDPAASPPDRAPDSQSAPPR